VRVSYEIHSPAGGFAIDEKWRLLSRTNVVSVHQRLFIYLLTRAPPLWPPHIRFYLHSADQSRSVAAFVSKTHTSSLIFSVAGPQKIQTCRCNKNFSVAGD